jgi:hypothetical protein
MAYHNNIIANASFVQLKNVILKHDECHNSPWPMTIMALCICLLDQKCLPPGLPLVYESHGITCGTIHKAISRCYAWQTSGVHDDQRGKVLANQSSFPDPMYWSPVVVTDKHQA